MHAFGLVVKVLGVALLLGLLLEACHHGQAQHAGQPLTINGGFESGTLAGWTTVGDVVVVAEGAFQSKQALRLSRSGDNLVATSATSVPFPLTPGEYEVRCALRSDLYAQDMSFNVAVQIRFENAAGKAIQSLEVATAQGKSAWKPIAKRCTAPAGTTRGQLIVELNKTFGQAWLDAVAVTPAQSSSELSRRVKFSSAYLGNMLYPEDRVRLSTDVRTPQRLTPEARHIQWDVRDYWNAPLCPPRAATLVEKGQASDATWEYQATLDASDLPLKVGPYYELHTLLKVVGCPPAEDSTSFAILPESSATAADPLQLPFGTHTWDARLSEYFALSARMGLRRCMIFWSWPAQPPYTPDFKGWELDCRINTPKRFGLHPFAMVYPAFDIERGDSKHTDESLRQGLRQTIEMYKKDGLWGFQIGNEPPQWSPKMVQRDVEIYRVQYEAIKKTDPDIVVIGSAIGPNEDFFKLGVQNYCDAVNIHGYGDLGEQRRNMRKYRDLFAKYGGAKPIYATEIGSMSQGLTRHEIACDIIRKAATFFADGGRFFTWFAVTYPDKEGTRRGSYGDSMDLFSGYLEQYNPRLDAIGYFHFVDLMGVKRFVQEANYADGTDAILFRDAQDNCLQVLWNLNGPASDVIVPLPDVHEVLVRHIDGTGVRLDAAGAGVLLHIGSEPVMLAYHQAAQTLPAQLGNAPIRLAAPPPDLIQGGTATVAFDLGKDSGTMDLVAPPLWPVDKDEQSLPEGAKRVSFHITVPASSPARAGRVAALLHDVNGRAFGELLLTIPVKGRITCELQPLAAMAVGKAGVRLTLHNNATEPQPVSWNVELLGETPMRGGEFDHSHAGTAEAYFAEVPQGQTTLLAGEERHIDLALSGVQPLSLYDVRGQVSDSAGKTAQHRRFMGGFAGVPKAHAPIQVDGTLREADWARAPVLRIDDIRQFFTYDRATVWKGPTDLSAKVRFLWDDRFLYLAAEVTDDVFVNSKCDEHIWSGDGLQMLVDPYRDQPEKLGRYDYFAGVGTKGPQVWRSLSAQARLPSGLASEIQFIGKRTNPANGAMTYEMAIPWSSLAPFTPTPGRNLGLGLIVNEDDGPGRTSFIGWFGGAHSKTVNQVGDLILLAN